MEQLENETRVGEQEKPITIEEASTLLHLQPSYIYKLTSQRKIPHCKRGKILYFFASELISWIRSFEVKTEEQLCQQAATYNLTKRN
ncbi:MAG: helix-turn-helix domain-containing protein [Bacteriodetes bacterium]|nr:helix-turn-helix domain-containing protein [Bacteroidota bacterium]